MPSPCNWLAYLKMRSSRLVTSRSSQSRGLWEFFGLTYLIMFFTWGVMAILQIPGSSTTRPGSPSLVSFLLLFLGGFSPSIAGIMLTWRLEGRKGLLDLWHRTIQCDLGWSAYLLIILLPIALFALRFTLHAMLGGSFTASRLLTHPSALLGFTLSILIGGPISEEFGWRGFALKRLLGRHSAGLASLILGLFWAVWHLPLFFIPGTTQAMRGNTVWEFAVFSLWIIGLSLLYTWLLIDTRSSIFAAILFHMTINWSGSFAATLFIEGLSQQLVSSLVVLVLGVALLWLSPHPPPRES
jgi:membrane protease YdiL (CAAX protease family)